MTAPEYPPLATPAIWPSKLVHPAIQEENGPHSGPPSLSSSQAIQCTIILRQMAYIVKVPVCPEIECPHCRKCTCYLRQRSDHYQWKWADAQPRPKHHDWSTTVKLERIERNDSQNCGNHRGGETEKISWRAVLINKHLGNKLFSVTSSLSKDWRGASIPVNIQEQVIAVHRHLLQQS
jgi:hypothetical protein